MIKKKAKRKRKQVLTVCGRFLLLLLFLGDGADEIEFVHVALHDVGHDELGLFQSLAPPCDRNEHIPETQGWVKSD